MAKATPSSAASGGDRGPSGGDRVACPDCGGRGTVSFGPDDLVCATCAGKGTVRA